MIVNTVSVEQHEDDYIRPNAYHETRLQICVHFSFCCIMK